MELHLAPSVTVESAGNSLILFDSHRGEMFRLELVDVRYTALPRPALVFTNADNPLIDELHQLGLVATSTLATKGLTRRSLLGGSAAVTGGLVAALALPTAAAAASVLRTGFWQLRDGDTYYYFFVDRSDFPEIDENWYDSVPGGGSTIVVDGESGSQYNQNATEMEWSIRASDFSSPLSGSVEGVVSRGGVSIRILFSPLPPT